MRDIPEIQLINLHTIKPIDKNAIINSARKTGKVLVVEEHQVAGGVGSAVCEVLAESCPVPVKLLGINDSFGESGTPDQLLKKYGIDRESIKIEINKLLKNE